MVGAAHDHETILAGAHGAPGPAIIERMDEDFIAAMLAELERDGVARVVASRAQPGAALFQPIHRVFNIALVEAHCDTFGEPRLDPAKIDSAGIVVRRIVEVDQRETLQKQGAGLASLKTRVRTIAYEGWLADLHTVRGWVELSREEELADPDPARRQPLRLTGDLRKDRELAGDRLATSEHAATLFVAPPSVNAATRRTLLFNVLPVASASRAGRPRRAEPEPSFDEWAAHLPNLLQQRSETRITLDAALRSDSIEKETGSGALLFMVLVRQLAQEFSILRPLDEKLTKDFLGALDQLAVTLTDGSTRKAGAYVLEAAQIIFGERDTDQSRPTLTAPKLWPAVSAVRARDLATRLRALSDSIRDNVVARPGSAGRYDEAGRRYAARAFIRVKCADGCPPKLVWSGYSEPFTIAQWFAASPVPPVQVALPDPMDKDFKKNARPGVAFTVPESVAKFLNQDMKKFFKGDGGSGNSMGLGFLCGFSIPIITLCAFIVLNIMLSLLNIIFWWLPYVKVCFPIPKK